MSYTKIIEIDEGSDQNIGLVPLGSCASTFKDYLLTNVIVLSSHELIQMFVPCLCYDNNDDDDDDDGSIRLHKACLFLYCSTEKGGKQALLVVKYGRIYGVVSDHLYETIHMIY